MRVEITLDLPLNTLQELAATVVQVAKALEEAGLRPRSIEIRGEVE